MIQRPLIAKAQTYENSKLKRELWLSELDTCMNMYLFLSDELSHSDDPELMSILDKHANYWYNRFHNAWNVNPKLAHYYNNNSRWLTINQFT